MTEQPKLMDVDSDNPGSVCKSGELGENGGQKISVSDHDNGLHQSATKSYSFVVDMERFSHIIEKEINSNTRVSRSLSRKQSGRNGERKISSNESSMVATSPRATFLGGSMPEKGTALGPPDQPSNLQVPHHHHHQITITNSSVGSTVAAESKPVGRRFSFRRSSPAWAIDPRRLLFFFATLSCMGTILLIYFTLSMGKINEDDNTALN